jgi:hypothetical protein
LKDLKNVVFGWSKSALVAFVLMIMMNLYWILPIFLGKVNLFPVSNIAAGQSSLLSFATLGHALSMLQPHWYQNVFGKVTPLLPEFILIPILVFSAPILFKRDSTSSRSYEINKNIGFWLLVALVSIFLVKGSNTPLPGIYNWLFSHIPGFSLFRDPTKFFFMVAISYSFLIGVTTDRLVTIFNWNLKIKNWKIRLLPLTIIVYFILLVSPIWLGKMTGIFAKPIYKNEFINAANMFTGDKGFGRILSIPTRGTVGFSSLQHPAVDATSIAQLRPFEIGMVGTYETFNFLREAPFMGELFDIAGIKYISYPYPDTRREELTKDNIDYYYYFLNQLSALPWIKDKLSDPPVPLLETKNNEDHFFIAENTFLVIGSDRIYWDLIKIPGFELSKNALIFNEERTGTIDQLDKVPINYIILYDKSETDLAASLINKDLLYFPAKNLNSDPGKDTAWWKRDSVDFLWLKYFLQEKYQIDNLDFDYGGGWAVGEGNIQLQITYDKFKQGEILLARVMKSSRGGEVSFYQGDKLIGDINTKNDNPQKVDVKLTGYADTPDQIFEYDKADINWYEVGRLANSDPLTIKTNGEVNIVNAISALTEEEWNHVNRMTGSYNVLNWSDLTDKDKERLFVTPDSSKLTYKYISPTHYLVNVEGLQNSATLAFSETYDSLWQANGKGSYPIYSLINGFIIDEDGEYDIYFSPQKYILPGLIMSGISLTLILALLILLREKRKVKV